MILRCRMGASPYSGAPLQHDSEQRSFLDMRNNARRKGLKVCKQNETE